MLRRWKAIGLGLASTLAAALGVQAAITNITVSPGGASIPVASWVQFNAVSDPDDLYTVFDWDMQCTDCPGWTRLDTAGSNSEGPRCIGFRGNFQIRATPYDVETDVPLPGAAFVKGFTTVSPDTVRWLTNPNPPIIPFSSIIPLDFTWTFMTQGQPLGVCATPVIGERIWRDVKWDGLSMWEEGPSSPDFYWDGTTPTIHDLKQRPRSLAFDSSGNLKPVGTLVDECFQQVYVSYPGCCGGNTYYTTYSKPIFIRTTISSTLPTITCYIGGAIPNPADYPAGTK